MLLRRHSLQQVFDNLVHEDAVVAFRSECRVRTGQILSKSTARQETHAAAALTSHCSRLRVVPAHERLNDGAERRDLPAQILRLEGVPNEVVEDVEG